MFLSLPPFDVFLLRKALPLGTQKWPTSWQYLCKAPEVPGRILGGLAPLTAPPLMHSGGWLITALGGLEVRRTVVSEKERDCLLTLQP